MKTLTIECNTGDAKKVIVSQLDELLKTLQSVEEFLADGDIDQAYRTMEFGACDRFENNLSTLANIGCSESIS